MPEPTLDQIAPGGVVQLDNSPANLDDATFDSLFPATTSPAIATVQQPPAKPDQSQQPPVVQQPPVQGDFFLKGDRSVYKTAEEATRGINEKDAVIEQMRQRYALVTGVDPITGKPVGVNGQPQAEVDFYQQPDQYLDALYNAAKKGGPEAYRDVQAKFLFDALKPLQPVIQKAAKDQAVETFTAEVPTAKGFVGSPAYTKALELNPQLNEAITISGQDQRFHSRLPGLYKLAYLTAQGMQLPELLQAQASQTQTPTQQVRQTAPVRTTVQPMTSSVPMTVTPPSFKTIDGIKAVIRDMEAKGVKLDL